MKLKILMLLPALAIALGVAAQSTERISSLKKDAEKAKKAFLKQDSTMIKFFKNAAGYVIFPNVGKGGLIIGGASGNGIVYTGGQAIGSARLTMVTVGLQAGGQAYREVIFFENQAQLDRFKQNNFEFSAQVSAVAAAAGISANAGYNEGVAVFTMAKKGLMTEASVGGQKFSFTPF
jgi:lipid-binding SYLF domain-containing protein